MKGDNMKRLFILLIGFTLILSACGSSNNKTISENELKGIYFNEKSFSNDELIKTTNYIIKGKVLELKEKSVKTVQTNANGVTYDINIPYDIYSVEVTENLKSPTNKTTIDLVFVEGTDDNIKVGNEYILFLEDNSKSKTLRDSYSLKSMRRGVYSLIENSDEMQCIPMQENKTISSKNEDAASKTFNMNYNDLKQKCEELKKE
jgi:hypothetical protein